MLKYVIILDPFCKYCLTLSIFMAEVIEKGQMSPQGLINDIDLLIDNIQHVHASLSRVQ